MLSLFLGLLEVFLERANFLQRLSFNGEGKISASQQLSEFNDFCDFINVYDENERCKMFTAAFEGRIRIWFEFLLAKSIHSFKQFTQLFLSAHENYSYIKLGVELENIRRYKDESLDDLFSIFMLICCRFHERPNL